MYEEGGDKVKEEEKEGRMIKEEEERKKTRPRRRLKRPWKERKTRGLEVGVFVF